MENQQTTDAAAMARVPPPPTGSDSPDRPKFELARFNPRRRARGAEAASVRVTWPDGDEEILWMSERDLKANMKEWGACDGLLDALNAYRQNVDRAYLTIIYYSYSQSGARCE